VTPPSTDIVSTKEQQSSPGRTRASRLLGRLVRGYRWLASTELLACAFVLVLTLGLRAALLPWLSIPEPVAHDEFSYLLAADTYAHGRLTNPPHPFWQHFETIHELMQPTYMSKYQPLQGLVLAFGQKFFGQPWIGVYLSAGLACTAICWMLQGWIAPSWALLGALLFVLRVGVLSLWMNSYFGGALPGIGGALVLGAVVRIWRRGQFAHSITWALGLAILALSRPFDAVVLGCATAAILLWFWFRSSTPLRTICVRMGLPALIVLTLCAAGIAYNDYRVTGHPLTLPYQLHEQQYAMASMFIMMPLRPEPAYHHAVMRNFWAESNVRQWRIRRLRQFPVLLMDFYIFDSFYFPFWVLFIPILLCPYDLETAEERGAVFLLLVMGLMIAALIVIQAHYVAAFAGVLYLRMLHSLTRLVSWHPWGKPVGRALSVLLVSLMVGAFCGKAFEIIRTTSYESPRHSVIQALQNQPGQHLVLLRYAPDHNPNLEWVYNHADIDASAIVWAREMGPEQDRPFLEYFRNRKVWLLEPDQSPPKLSLYPREVTSR
jgi:hypothetical protein